MNGSTKNRLTAALMIAGAGVLAFAALKPPAISHPVTESMTAAAGTMAGRRVTALQADGSDGRPHSPATEATNRPAVLIFIQDSCPCSEAAEPYFHRLHAAYGDCVAFFGVVDADLETARDWSARHQTPYPVLADPDRRIIAACEAERSAYVMLVTPGGTIESLWPGYSAGMLQELGTRLARLSGANEEPISTEGAPTEMASGCSF
jgi:peroxiredoxin